MTETFGQFIKWDFETNGDLEIRDKNSKLIYAEDSDGNWVKDEWDSQDNLIYCGDSKGNWEKYEYDFEGNEIYFENSDGIIEDNRPKNVI